MTSTRIKLFPEYQSDTASPRPHDQTENTRPYLVMELKYNYPTEKIG